MVDRNARPPLLVRSSEPDGLEPAHLGMQNNAADNPKQLESAAGPRPSGLSQQAHTPLNSTVVLKAAGVADVKKAVPA